MSEKRFIVETVEITDCKTGKSRIAKVITDTNELCSSEDLYELCDDLNELHEENQRLKNDCSILVQSNQEYRKENEQLQKETVFLAYWKRKAMILLMQVRRLTPRMTDEEVMEFSKELDDE